MSLGSKKNEHTPLTRRETHYVVVQSPIVPCSWRFSFSLPGGATVYEHFEYPRGHQPWVSAMSVSFLSLYRLSCTVSFRAGATLMDSNRSTNWPLRVTFSTHFAARVSSANECYHWFKIKTATASMLCVACFTAHTQNSNQTFGTVLKEC